MRWPFLLILCLLLGSCVYRMVTPRQLEHGIRIDIQSPASRLPGVQRSLHRALAASLADDLGWSVRPSGQALLRIKMQPETIDAASGNAQGIVNSWLITVNCEVSLIGHGQTQTSRQQASSSYSSLDNEQNGIDAACDALADNISNWLVLVTSH